MPAPSPSRTLAAAVLPAIVMWICFFSHLTALGLVGPDEPRYAAVAHDMAATGDWVTPRLYGEPWFEKPILYYWAAGACFRFFGGSELPARLPSALGGLAAAFALAWLAWEHYGPQTAWAVLMIFPACIATIGFARAATPDMLFSAALALAMACAAGVLRQAGALRGAKAALQNGRSRNPPVILFGAWLGVATLAKGPAAVVLAGGSLAIWAALTRQWRQALRLAHPLVAVSFCLVAAPWYALCALRNPEFIHTFFFLHNFERYLTPVFQHRQPFWFFGPILLLGPMPWTALLLGFARTGSWRAGRNSWRDSSGLFLACWVVFAVVFFSFSQSKLPGYVLPAIPPLAVLLASRLRLEERSMGSAWLTGAVGVTWVGLSFSFSYWMQRLPPEGRAVISGYHALVFATALGGGLVIVYLSLFRRPLAAVAFSSLLLAALVEIAALRFLPRIDPYLSARVAARAAELASVRHESLRTYKLQRAWHYALNFYVGRELPEWEPSAPVAGASALGVNAPATTPAFVYTNSAGVEELARSGRTLRILDRTSPEALLVRVEPRTANGLSEPPAADFVGRN